MRDDAVFDEDAFGDSRIPVTFIAIDGEGLSRDDGSHDYVLLAASDRSYIEEYALGGLSTEQCFDYLLDVGERNKGAVLVGFYTSYDVNKIFRDLPESVLAGLWVGSLRTWRAPSGGYMQYRIEYVPNRVLKLRQGCWIDDEKRGPHWKTFRSVVWWDCFQFFQMSFVKALNDWGVTDAATVAAISAMKDARGTFDAQQRRDILAYCQDECRLLVDMMGRVSETLRGLDIKLTSWYGAGSIASALFKKYGVKAHVKQEWGVNENAAVMGAYFGGRIETFAVGINADSCINYDVRSAYPAATASLPSLAECIAERAESYDYAEPYAIWHVVWKRRTARPSRLAPFPFRHKKRIFWPHTGEGWYHAEEVRAAIDVFSDPKFNIEIEVIEGYRVVLADNAKPFEWVPTLYAERAEYKRNGDPREKILKLGLNSLYGKCAQSIGGKDGKPPPFQCYFWAGMITADCRARLLRAAAMSDDVLAIATDGLFVGTRIDALTEFESEELGAWESVEVEPGLMFIQPGVYATPSLGKRNKERDDGLIGFAKSRGFSARGIDYDKLALEWRARRMAGFIEIPETRFIGFGYALATNSLATKWGTWQDGVKTIHFSGTTSKSFDPTGAHDAELVRLVSPNVPTTEISAPYTPRVRSADEQKEYELQSELLASQPDLDDNLFTWRA